MLNLLAADFITEGWGNGDSAGGQEGGGLSGKPLPLFAAQALGIGPEVPRCLRWRSGQLVSGLHLLRADATERLAWRILAVGEFVCWFAKQTPAVVVCVKKC
jgi:hypothetical protein